MKELSINEHGALITRMVDKGDALTVITNDTPVTDSTHTRRTFIPDKVESDQNIEPLSAHINHGAERWIINVSSWRKQKIRPIKVWNDNRTENVDRRILEKCLITFDICGKRLTEWFNVATLGDQSLILELLWLEKHDPMMISDRRL